MPPPLGEPLLDVMTSPSFARLTDDLSHISEGSFADDATPQRLREGSTYATSEDESLHRAEMDFLTHHRTAYVQQQMHRAANQGGESC